MRPPGLTAPPRAGVRPDRARVALVIAVLIVGLGLLVMAVTSDVSAVARLVGAVLVGGVTIGLAALISSRSDARRGLAALLAGILGVSAGGAIGPVWLVTTGADVVAITALACLAAGLLLLAVGAWLLIRATPGWWRLAAIPVAFLILQFVLLPVAGALYGVHPPRTPVSVAMPPAAREVSFETPDGVTMVAWYTPSSNGATIVVLPGSGGDKGSTLAHAEILVEHGYGVLALDSRGTGESGGIGNAWGWHGVADVTGAVAWLVQQPEVEPERIGALGLSMGGEVAITAAAADIGLRAVVAEGVSARVPGDLAYLPGDPRGIIQRLDGDIMWAVADLMTDAAPPMTLTQAVTQASDVPMLLIVGAASDEMAARPLLVAARPTLDVWDVPDTPHIQSLARHPDEWEARVVGFLDETLG
jgi:dienelactone hydrolase